MVGGVLFLVGFSGLVLSSIFLAWEAQQPVRLFKDVRSRADKWVAIAYRTLVFGEIPHVYRTSLIETCNRVVHQAVHSLVLLLRAIERPLARLSRRMTYSQGISSGQGERNPSAFLKDIAVKDTNGKKPDNPV